MPLLQHEPKCSVCKTDESDVWENVESDILCDKCYEMQSIGDTGDPVLLQKLSGAENLEEKLSSDVSSMHTGTATNCLTADHMPGKVGNPPYRSATTGKETSESKSSTRKSARIKPSKSKSQTAVKTQATKGRSRRVIFKKKPMKAPSASSTVITSDHIFYKGFYWQVGDVVSVVDDDGSLYYAQLRGFLQDPFNEKSAVITWLIPTSFSPAGKFDASTYILGPEEDVPRKMEYFEFVCHAPSDYFHSHNAPYAIHSSAVEPGFIWTGMKTETQPSFGSISAEDDFSNESESLGLKLINKTDSGRKVKEFAKRMINSKEQKLK